MALTRRVEVLFDPDQYSRLDEISRSRGESVAALIRDAVAREYLQPTLVEKRSAVEELLQMEVQVGAWEEVKEDLGKQVLGRLEAS